MSQSPFDLIEPDQPVAGLVFASPHSGRDYGADFLARSDLDPHRLRSSEDAWVDQLIAAAPGLGVPLLTARTPRAYVDLNRSPEELDPALIEGARRGAPSPRVSSGLGVIPRVVANGRAIYRGRISRAEAQARIEHHWYPYHRALQALLDRQRAQFGQALLVDCHSMPHEAIFTHCHSMPRVPDVVLGDRFGAAASGEIMDLLQSVFEAEGLRVARNTPFAGAFISQHYGRPNRAQHVVQIEIDRSLYMDEATLARHSGFARLTDIMTRVIRDLSGWARPVMPLAAE